MSSSKACHGSHHLAEVFRPCRNRYLVALQDPTVSKKFLGRLLENITMMQSGALCRQNTTQPCLTKVLQKFCSKIAIPSPEGNRKCCGGWALFVKTTVLFAVNIKPTCDSTVTKSCKGQTLSSYVFANKKMSSANRRSSNAGWPSPKSNLFKGTSRLQRVIAQCSIAENK